MKLELSVVNQFRALGIAIYSTILCLGAWSLFGFQVPILIIFLALYLVTVAPAFILHINYYIKSKGLVCIINPDSISINKNGQETELPTDAIKYIVVYKSASIETGGIPITAMESYFFVRIFDNSNNTYPLTCLLHPQIDKKLGILKGVEIYKQRGIFNFIGNKSPRA
jgi:hypothetical protein